MKVSDIGICKIGLPIGVAKIENGNKFNVLSMKSINSLGTYTGEFDEELLNTERVNKDLICKKGDIIIKMMSPYSVSIVDDKFEGFLVSSSYIILRVDSDYSGYINLIRLMISNELSKVNPTGMIKRLLTKDVNDIELGEFGDFDVSFDRLTKLSGELRELSIRYADENVLYEKYINKMIINKRRNNE